MTHPAPDPHYGNRQAWYLVFSLTLCNILSQVDRFAMTLLVTPMQRDLGLNDPDRAHRRPGDRPVLRPGGASAGASGGPVQPQAADPRRIDWLEPDDQASGLAIGFWTLCIARLLLAVGDAALGPSASSMIGNVFRSDKLSAPLSAYASAGSLGNAAASLLVAGLLFVAPFVAPPLTFGGEPMAPWRVVMIGLGLVGLLPMLTLLFAREPVRPHHEGDRPDFRAFVAYLKSHRLAYLPCYLGYALFVLPFVAMAFWAPTAFERVHGLSPTITGAWMGVGYLVAGAPGTIFGGWLSGWLERRGHADGKLLVLLIATLASVPAVVASQLAGNPIVAMGFLWVAMACAAMALGPVTAAIQVLAPDQFRAQAAVVLYLLIFIVAFMGIPITGFLTDTVFGDPKRIGHALIVLALSFGALATGVVLRFRSHYVAAAQAREAELP
ncbi:MAG: MFS transporter [Thermomonas sp.]|nr:MFS transporter [Thermomonas sp.]